MKNSKSFYFVIAFAIAVISSCSDTGSESTKESAATTKSESESVSENQVAEVTESYLQLKDALVESNAEKARSSAEALSATLEQSKINLNGNIQEHAAKLAQVEDIENQRQIFKELSKEYYNLIKSNGSGEQVLYQQYCPMADNNNGAFWVSAEKEIANPYFGDKMMKCGKVQEVID